MNRTRIAACLAFVLAACAALWPALAQGPEKRPGLEQHNLDKKGLALAGFDPVSYFPTADGQPGKPVRGKTELALTVTGVTYRFASAANRDRFAKDAASFEPAYGGWCAYAMAKGDKVEVDPESFLIEDGRLLLFYKSFFNDTRAKWRKEGAQALRPKADAAWKKWLETPPKSAAATQPRGAL